MNGWEKFCEFVGLRGVIALLLVGGYLGAVSTGVALPGGYNTILAVILAAYFARNGRSIVDAMRNR